MAREQKKENKELTPEERLQQALVPEEEWPYELPEGWKWVRIGGISELYNGRAFKPTDWSNEGLPIVRIQNLNDREAEYNHYAGEVDEQYALHGGELLFAWSGTPGTSFGAHIWWGKEAVLNQHIFKMEFDENLLNKRYFMHAINQQLNKLISVAHGGAGLQHVTKGVFENTAIPLPDLATQESLVSFIDKQCARLDEVSEEIESVLDSSEKRKQSILYKAMTGDLSERWRKENGYSLEEWDRRSVNDICRDIKVGIVIKPTRYYTDSSGIPAFRSANVREFHVQDSDWVYINELDDSWRWWNDLEISCRFFVLPDSSRKGLVKPHWRTWSFGFRGACQVEIGEGCPWSSVSLKSGKEDWYPCRSVRWG